MGLRTLKLSDEFSDLDVLPIKEAKVDRHVVVSDVLSSAGQKRVVASNAKPAGSNPSTDRGVSYDVHIFYHSWYGNPQTDERYLHWDHILVQHWDPKIAASYPRGRHVPPEDIGSSFYPELGPYSSRDPEVLEYHMEQISTAGAGTLSNLSLYSRYSMCEHVMGLGNRSASLCYRLMHVCRTLLTTYRKFCVFINEAATARRTRLNFPKK